MVDEFVMIFEGCYTALVTPMKRSFEIDFTGLERLIEFQVEEGVEGIVVMGTTGESSTLDWEEHKTVTKAVHTGIDGKALTIAGTGSNSTKEAFEGTSFADELGVETALLIDPYYNGPSSLEIRKEYVEPLARGFPKMEFIPYIIPGRTGTQLLPQDLAILHTTFDNVNAVKEGTGDLTNMALTRKVCGDDFCILSADDEKTYDMMTSPQIRANGVISVISNIAPAAVQEMVEALNRGNNQRGLEVAKALDPLFEIVTVRTEEETLYGPRTVKARNPLACKTMMNITGMPSGPCRQPLGRMTKAGIDVVLESLRTVYEDNPWVLQSIEASFDVDLGERLYNTQYWKDLHYA